MKVVILAGGLGSRLSEETVARPKPMVEIGGRPILWHIMKFYSHFGLNDFVICAGYKGHMIKEYFANYFIYSSDITFDVANSSFKVLDSRAEPWKVTVVDTGELTMTGGRLKRIAHYLDDKSFCLTYGDGLADINISALINFHVSGGKLATVTATQPPGRFGSLTLKKDTVTSFEEKPASGAGYINGGFFVLAREVLDYIKGDDTVWEQEPLRQLVQNGQLNAFVHTGFWQPMDTARERNQLEHLWKLGKAPWKLWK